MECKNVQLPGIIRVGWIECNTLPPHMQLKARAGMPVETASDVNYIEIQGEAVAKRTAKHDRHGESESATLEFHTLERLPSRNKIAFIADCVDGHRYIIGNREPPYPVIETTESSGAASSERAGYDVKVSHVGVKAMIKVD